MSGSAMIRSRRPLVAPTLREETVDELAPLREVLQRLAAQPVDLAIFQTGVGVVRVLLLVAKDLSGQKVVVQHHGAVNLTLVEALKTRGAEVLEAITYHWARLRILPRSKGSSMS